MVAARELVVTARLGGPVHAPEGLPILDGLLAWAVATRDGLPPPLTAAEATRVEIPIAVEPGGRFHLCSQGFAEVEAEELRYTNKRPPIAEYQALADPKMKRVDIGAGANKGYRIPRPVQYLADDLITWWAVGDADAVRPLLDVVTHIGKRRAVGWGRVVEWRVSVCDPWPGFPVLRDGQPLRPLPLDWPGLAADASSAFKTLTFPYWDHSREELVACPRHH